MEPSPWSSYGQHYPRLGGAAGVPSPPSELNLGRETDYNNPQGHLFLPSAPHGLGGPPNQDMSSFNPMGILSPGGAYEGSLLPSPFQQAPKGHFTGLPQGGSSFFKPVNKDDLNDLRGGFAHRPDSGNPPPPPAEHGGNHQGALFDGHTAAGSGGGGGGAGGGGGGGNWRHPAMPPTSCGPFGILPHEAVLSRTEKSSQQAMRSARSSYDSAYSSVLPSPSRPPSSFIDPNMVPHSASLTAQNDSQFYGDGYYGCSQKFPMFNSAMSSSASSPSPSYSNYSLAGKDKPTDHESFQANTSVIVSHLPNGQSSRPGVISSASNNICHNSPGSNMYMQNYQYHSPSSSQPSPSVVQSPQHQSQDSRGMPCTQNYNQINSNQPSPSVLHSPYPAMNTPAPAATPAHVTPPASIGQAYCPMMSDGSPHGLPPSVISAPSCSTSSYKSMGGNSTQSPGKDSNSQHSMGPQIPTDPLQLGNTHYISPVSVPPSELHEDMVEMVGSGSSSGDVKSMMNPEMSGMDPSMVDKHHQGAMSMDKGMEMDMYNNSQDMRMMQELDDHLNMPSKHDMMSQQNQMMSQGLMGHGVMDYQTAPVRKRGRGRPRGSVNKRGRRGRRGRKAGPYCFEGERYVPSQPPPNLATVRNSYPSRMSSVSRAPHNRVFTSHRSYNACDNKSMPGEQSYMPMQDYGRHGDVYSSNMEMDSKVFNFDEHESDPDMTSSFSKFMSEARESAAQHNSSSGSDPMNPSSCMKQKHPTSFLDVNLKDKPTSSGMEHCYGGMNQEPKPKNYMSIEDDLGFLAELPPIDPEPPNTDGSNSKNLSKEAGGFLQSFLSFIGGNSENTSRPPTGARGRRGGTRGRRPRGPRGPRGGGAYRGRGRGRGRGGLRAWPPAPRQEYTEFHNSSLNSNVQYSNSDHEAQKDCVVPNPEAPSFSSDDEDNTTGGIADSVAFVIRRLSEDEPPNNDPAAARSKSKSRDKYSECAKMETNSYNVSEKHLKKMEWTPQSIAKYRKLGRIKHKIATIECSNPGELKSRIRFEEVPCNTAGQQETYEFNNHTEDPAVAVRRTSMRRCKEEMIKKQEELKKLSEKAVEEAAAEKPLVPPGTLGIPRLPLPEEEDSEEYDSDSDPAWTPHKPGDGIKPNSSHQPKELGKRGGLKPGPKPGRGIGRGARRHGLTLRFPSTTGEGESRVVHILKRKRNQAGVPAFPLQGGRLYTRVQRIDRGGETKLSLLKHGTNKENRESGAHAPSTNGEMDAKGKSDKSKTTTPVDQDDITECFFRTGDFVVAKVDVDSPNPAIWQIEGKSLLQRFEAFEKDGRVLYRNASSYSAWNPSIKNKYLGVTVRLRYSSRAYTIAEYIGLSSTDNVDMNGETEESINAHPQRENFEVFLQTLISQVLDPNFIAEIIKEDDDYFLSHLKGIEELTRERKGHLLEPSWDEHLRQCAELYPCVNVTACKNQENCQLCQQSPALHVMQFHGQVYDQVTLSNQGGYQPAPHSNSFRVCGNCAQAVVLYHSLHHHKYNFFLKCRTRVTKERTEDALKESHIILEQCLQDTTWINEMFSEMQEMWASCDNKLR